MHILRSLFITLVGGASATGTTAISSVDTEAIRKPLYQQEKGDPFCLRTCIVYAMSLLPGHGDDNEQYFCPNIKIMEDLIKLCLENSCRNHNLEPGTPPPQIKQLGCLSCYKCCYKCHSRCREAPAKKYCKHQEDLQELAAGENVEELLENGEELMTNETGLMETRQAILAGEIDVSWASCLDDSC